MARATKTETLDEFGNRFSTMLLIIAVEQAITRSNQYLARCKDKKKRLAHEMNLNTYKRLLDSLNS